MDMMCEYVLIVFIGVRWVGRWYCVEERVGNKFGAG